MAADDRRSGSTVIQRKSERGARPAAAKVPRGGGSARHPNLTQFVEAGGVVGVSYRRGRYLLSAASEAVEGREAVGMVLTYGSLDDALDDLEACAAECVRQMSEGVAPGERGATKKKAGKAAVEKATKAAGGAAKGKAAGAAAKKAAGAAAKKAGEAVGGAAKRAGEAVGGAKRGGKAPAAGAAGAGTGPARERPRRGRGSATRPRAGRAAPGGRAVLRRVRRAGGGAVESAARGRLSVGRGGTMARPAMARRVSERRGNDDDLRCGIGVVLVDVINTFDFEGSAGLVRAAARAAPAIERLAARARAKRVPVIYVNDNFGRWRSDFKATLRLCTEPQNQGRRVAERLRPHEEDYFVLKPQHSGFYSTTLELLLNHLGVHTLVLAGFATNLCVVFTANDAHMRGYHLFVPADCTASNTPALTRAALAHVKTALGADIRRGAAIDLARPGHTAKKPRGQPF
ncbi:MAG TPA: isochorismatase family cysteine hydrolase [Polyangiaceae bacterium]|nr:isochorismatase family cysteine hydrolase [Polyangiaceae bacterium]